jgi:hypothetical protein
MKACLLQFRQRAGGAGDQNGAIYQMVGQLSRKRVMRELVRIDVEFDESCGVFPDSVVIIGTVLKSRRRGACARCFFNASRWVAPGGVNADLAAAAADSARADARPITVVAAVNANVFTTLRLPVTIFTLRSPALLFRQMGSRPVQNH